MGHYYSYKHLYDNRSSTQVESFVNRLGTYTFTYDVKGNITQEVFVPWGENLQGYTKTYEYDALNQLTRCIDGIGNHWYYQYDKAGNIVYEKCDDSQDVCTIKHYGYADGNWRDKLTSYDGESISYDNIGNPTTYRGASLTWSEGRRLASYSKGSTNVTFNYDADGKRISKNVNGTVYNYIYNQGTLVGLSNNNGILLKFICDEKGEYVGFIQGGLTYYYVRNIQNDVVGISDTNGNVLVTYTYDPWGKVTSIEGNTWLGESNPIRYRGYFYDTETQLYYLQSRYYDPESNRFINADEPEILLADDVSLLQSNLYAYCWNNPVINKDSSGYWVETALDVAFIVGDVASIVANPANVIGYVELAADVVGLVVPGMTGGGKIVRVVMNSDNLVDATKVVDKIVDSNKVIKTKAIDGIAKHNKYNPIGEIVDETRQKLNRSISKECKLRPDGVDKINNIIYELKPYNKNSYKKALKQVQKYVDELGGKWNIVLDFYMR